MTLLSSKSHFEHRALSVGRVFSQAPHVRVSLTDVARRADAAHEQVDLEAVDAQQRRVRLSDGSTKNYDALLVAIGARTQPVVAHALTWLPEGAPEVLGGLLRDIDEGYVHHLTIEVPAGPVWPLPAYELALLISCEARAMCSRLEVRLVTAEPAPLAVFSVSASRLVAEELQAAGVAVSCGAELVASGGWAVLHPGGEAFATSRVLTIPQLIGRDLEGVPADTAGFIPTDEQQGVIGLPGV